VVARRAAPPFAILAPHGGGIEPGTTEIADAIAGATHSFHTLEGLKPSGNADLHITSTRFDEPLCLTLFAHCAIVLTIHGEDRAQDGEGVFVGGRDTALGEDLTGALREAGFDARKHPDPDLQGQEPTNLCNRGTSGAGVQLELSKAMRTTLFKSLTREGRRCPTERFDVFTEVIRVVIGRGSRRGEP
jgi:phage replication-related protein YjqB (UPF0714/DUF867 family)